MRTLNVDWAQFSGLIYDISAEPSAWLQGSTFRVVSMSSNQLWREVYEIEHFNGSCWLPFCYLSRHTSSKYIRQDAVSLRIANHQLYTPGWHQVLCALLYLVPLFNLRISRVDFAFDSDEQCTSFGSLCALAHAMLRGDAVRRGSRKMTASLQSPISGGAPVLNALTIGSHAGVSQWQLYNKSLELKQQSVGLYCPKQYIKDNWTAHGWDGVSEVWRCEIRLRGNARSIVNKATGELCPLSLDDITADRLVPTARAVFAKWSEIHVTVGATDSTVAEHIGRRPLAIKFSAEDLIIETPKTAQQPKLPSPRYGRAVRGYLLKLRQYLQQEQAESVLYDVDLLSESSDLLDSLFARRSDKRPSRLEEEAEYYTMFGRTGTNTPYQQWLHYRYTHVKVGMSN